MERKLHSLNGSSKSCGELCKTQTHIYYNINIVNTTNVPIPATFNEARTDSIVDIPEDYNLAIVRFSVPMQAVPIFYMPIIPYPNTNPNLSSFAVGLSYGGFTFSQKLIYVPRNISPVPPTPTALNPNWPITPYYGVYSYQQLLDMINTAYATLFSALKTAIPSAPPTEPQYFTYDPTTELITLWTQKLYDPAYVGAPTVNIYMNGELYSYFESFEVQFNGYSAPANEDFQFIIKDNGNNSVDISDWLSTTSYSQYNVVNYEGQGYISKTNTNLDNNPLSSPTNWAIQNNLWNATTTYAIGNIVSFMGIYYVAILGSTALQPNTSPSEWTPITLLPDSYYQFPQEYATLYNWNALRNVVFLTNNIPVVAEYIPINNNSGTQSTNNFLSILTDFQATAGNASSFKGYLQFANQGEFRRLDMKGKQPLRNFDIQVNWQDQLQNLYPIFIPPFDSISIKMMFELKGTRQGL